MRTFGGGGAGGGEGGWEGVEGCVGMGLAKLNFLLQTSKRSRHMHLRGAVSPVFSAFLPSPLSLQGASFLLVLLFSLANPCYRLRSDIPHNRPLPASATSAVHVGRRKMFHADHRVRLTSASRGRALSTFPAPFSPRGTPAPSWTRTDRTLRPFSRNRARPLAPRICSPRPLGSP